MRTPPGPIALPLPRTWAGIASRLSSKGAKEEWPAVALREHSSSEVAKIDLPTLVVAGDRTRPTRWSGCAKS
jgi:hypothetical protein